MKCIKTWFTGKTSLFTQSETLIYGATKSTIRDIGRSLLYKVIAIVCNFLKSQNLTAASLNHFELDTFFHEFGDALYSLLTHYQHFSGTIVAFDLAKTPSNLFENTTVDGSVGKHTCGSVTMTQHKLNKGIIH
ncbi:putative mitochondrial intermediate peptidase, mitochondrial [Artemisia annua]|uniref:Putative mitochondrial intermediate peptidase, mitochondrial n=1 Tax=Artemisia annua TaxID=35608 RepID=A0A2U1PSU4_ARTAN|nr:putative mitochondrial intermediate peptidase, mitochondrial [Artemisia annua]